MRTKAFAVMSDSEAVSPAEGSADDEGASLGKGYNKLTVDSSVVAIDTGGSEEWQDRGDNCQLGVRCRFFRIWKEGMLL